MWSRWTSRPLISRNKKLKWCYRRPSWVSYRSTRKEKMARYGSHRISSSCRKWFKRIQVLYKHSNLKIAGSLNQVKYWRCQIQLNLACCQLCSKPRTQRAQIGCVKLYIELLERISRNNIMLILQMTAQACVKEYIMKVTQAELRWRKHIPQIIWIDSNFRTRNH